MMTAENLLKRDLEFFSGMRRRAWKHAFQNMGLGMLAGFASYISRDEPFFLYACGLLSAFHFVLTLFYMKMIGNIEKDIEEVEGRLGIHHD